MREAFPRQAAPPAAPHPLPLPWAHTMKLAASLCPGPRHQRPAGRAVLPRICLQSLLPDLPNRTSLAAAGKRGPICLKIIRILGGLLGRSSLKPSPTFCIPGASPTARASPLPGANGVGRFVDATGQSAWESLLLAPTRGSRTSGDGGSGHPVSFLAPWEPCSR